MLFHEDGSLPDSFEVFVFGSNLAGIHGAGAALVAVKKYGAVGGHGVGLHGRSYAIPTKDVYIRTLPLGIIEMYVTGFRGFCQRHPDIQFFVTRVGCGLAGYLDEDIAPMFRGLDNCNFPEEWRAYVQR